MLLEKGREQMASVREYEIIQHPQIDGITIFFDTLSYRTPHSHPEWELVWVTEGSLSIRTGGTQYAIAPGEMAVLAPQQPHELHGEPDSCTFLCVQVSPRVLERFSRPPGAPVWKDCRCTNIWQRSIPRFSRRCGKPRGRIWSSRRFISSIVPDRCVFCGTVCFRICPAGC